MPDVLPHNEQESGQSPEIEFTTELVGSAKLI